MKFWGQRVLHDVYLINKLHSLVINWKTPFEMLFQKSPRYDHLKVFGCLCFASTLRRNRTKMDERIRKCVFIGYPASVKGYTLYDLNDHSIFISRDVYFYESSFPFKQDGFTDSDILVSNDIHIYLRNLYFPQENFSQFQGVNSPPCIAKQQSSQGVDQEKSPPDV